jgi:glycosyltransferase involved in cell wall biosynthesis
LKILFLVTEDWYFLSHRLALARKLRDMGAEVLVMTRVNRLGEAIARENFRIIPWRVSRGSLNPFRELVSFLQVLRCYRREKPDLAHHVALKGIVYGGLAARLSGGIASVNAVVGLGHAFVNESGRFGLLRRALFALFRWALDRSHARIIFQNKENQDVFIQAGIIKTGQSVIIRGAGVDPQEFIALPEPSGVPLIVLPTRMLWEKGVGEFVGAASKLQERHVPARVVLVGDTDPEHRASVPQSQLRQWADKGALEWWGHRQDMPAVFSQANLVCFPSYYGEGVPKVLIEAAACGRAIVTTDVAGCREVVRDGENGLLVPARDPVALADAIEKLLKDPALRARMGARGRQIAEQEFSEDLVIRETLVVYRGLLGARWTLPTD